jgi:uncharacterized membrane protein
VDNVTATTLEEQKKTESHLRSVLKGVSWRIVGTIDTMVISFFVSGNALTALKIGFTEVFTKVFLFYLHERVWLYFVPNELQTKATSLIKAVSWRTVGTIDTMVLAWYYTGNPVLGLKIGFAEVFTKIILFYLHDRLWAKVPIGTVRNWFRAN